MPQSTVIVSADPYEYQRSIRVQSFELAVTAAGEFRSELTRIALHRLWMQRSRESLSRISYSSNFKDRSVIFFLADAQQAPMRHTGMELSPNHIMFYSPGAEHHQRSSEPCRWASMSLPTEALAAMGRAITGRDLAAPKVTSLIRPPPALMGRLLRLHAAAGQLAATAPEILAHREVSKAIEQQLIGAMVSCLADDSAEHNYEGHQRMSVMRRFEYIVEANLDKPLYLADVCAAIGVPARTLRFHCLHHLGIGPRQYLLLRRMTMARRALALADPASRTVTEIATQHGFWELGRFAVAFRKLFGESPSATLRRSADSRVAEELGQNSPSLSLAKGIHCS